MRRHHTTKRPNRKIAARKQARRGNHTISTAAATIHKVAVSECPRVKTLREYQAYDVRFITSTDDACCVEGPTGSGKTLTATTIAAILLREGGATGVLITTPMEHIEDGFTNRDYDQIRFPMPPGSASAVYKVPSAFVQAARHNGGGDGILDYLSTDRDHALACTHLGLFLAKLPGDLTGKVLIVDEAHRAPIEGNKFSKVIDQWEERGGRVVFFTATPFRGDGTRVIRKGMRVLRRSLAQHMMELDTDGRTYAPSNLEISIVPLLEKSTTVQRFQGETAPSSATAVRIAKTMVKSWKEEGKPPLMVRIPPKGDSDQFVKRVLAEFRKEIGDPSRVFDASGVGKCHKDALIALLHKERALPYEQRTIDVIVGIQRTLEGTDWPHCAAMYVYGLPGSPTAIVQLIGRTTRKKGIGHPFADTAITRFFVETFDENTCDLLQRTQALNALGIACLLGDIQSPAEWSLEKEIIEEVKACAEDEQHMLDMLAELGTSKENDIRVRMEAQYGLAALMDKNPKMTVGDAVQAAADVIEAHASPEEEEVKPRRSRNSGDEEELFTGRLLTAVRQIAAEQVNMRAQQTGDDSASRIARAIARRSLVEGLPLSAVRRRVYEGVVDGFSKETLVIGANITQALHHAHRMMGGTMQHYAARIFGRTVLVESQVQEWGTAFNSKFDRYPRVSDGSDGLPEGEDWSAIDMALRYGKRGLKGGSSLAKMFGYDRPDHSIPLILEWADNYHRLTGRWPHTDLRLEDSPPQTYGLPDPKTWGFAESWHAIDMALRGGWRGLPGGMTLYSLLIEHGRIRPNKKSNRGKKPGKK